MADQVQHDVQVVNIDQWAGTLTRILEDVPQYMCNPGHPGRISRLPESLREVDIKAYEPYFISIGPYHHAKPSLQLMENRKSLALRYVLKERPEHTLKYYLEEIKNIERAARSFYTDVEMASEKFVQMLLLDSLFVIIAFCGRPKSEERRNATNSTVRLDNGNMEGEGMGYVDDSENMHLMAMEDDSDDERWGGESDARMFSIMFEHDLFLVENQLPFFVLEKVYAIVYGGSEGELLHIMKYNVANLLSGYTKLEPEMVSPQAKEVHHLLHLCHMFFRPTLQQESIGSQFHESNQMFRLGSVVQLYEAGVSFEAKSGSTQHSLLDIAFDSSGKMTMPCLHVEDNTNSLLRNLIALEQMKYPTMGLNVSAYAVFLLHLVTVPEDVKLLRKKGIIQHHLASDKEMIHFINRLSVGLSFDYMEDRYSLKHVFHELKKYTERRRPRWKAWLKHRYFNNPWTVISLLAASILLLLSVVQTYYTVYSYYYPYHPS